MRIFAAINGIGLWDFLRMTPRDVYFQARANQYARDVQGFRLAIIVSGAVSNIIRMLGAMFSKHKKPVDFLDASDLYPPIKQWSEK